MKKPKDILFAKHRPAETKLDAIREEAVTAFRSRRSSEIRPQPISNEPDDLIVFLRDLFLPRPQAWTAFAAIWILIFALKVATRDETHVVARKAPPSREIMVELRQQKLFFAELIGLHEARDGEPPKPFVPRPRSERRHETMSA